MFRRAWNALTDTGKVVVCLLAAIAFHVLFALLFVLYRMAAP
jgi:hypothetical protein